MFRSLISLVIVVAFAINSFAQTDKFNVRVSGKVLNPKGKAITITSPDGFKQSIEFIEPGEFSDSFEISKKGLYSFTEGNESTAIYLDKDYDLYISVDAKEFDESIKYKGIGAQENNYLAKKYLINETQMGDMMALYKLDEKEFIKKQTFVNDEYKSLLKVLKDKDFIELQNKNIEYDYFLALSSFEGYHQYVTKDNDFKVSEEFLKPIESINYNLETDYLKYESYKKLVSAKYITDLFDAKKVESSIIAIQNIESKIIKEGIQKQVLENIDIKNKNLELIYKTILDKYTDKEFINKVKTKFESIKPLMKGQPSAKFSYQDIDGKTVSLDDLKGKYVYIDVWATWCGPCIGEIPHLKKLEADYHQYDIAFVSISVDKERAFDKWKKMVTDKELKGYQLFADKDWSSDFIKAYQIKGIPTFILIDKKGNIISASATRPSNPDTRKLFDELLK